MASDPTALLLATRSADKAREIRAILGPDVRLLSLDDAGVEAAPEERDVEAFATFHENALAKARFFHRRTGLHTVADDSGICADALGGRPGVRSRRFSRRTDLEGPDLDLANNRALLDAMARVHGPLRSIRYVCAAVLVRPDRPPLCTIGTVTGHLLHSPRGSAGFGYDPLFLLPDNGLTFAELDPPAKNRLSHRGRAFRALAAAL